MTKKIWETEPAKWFNPCSLYLWYQKHRRR